MSHETKEALVFGIYWAVALGLMGRISVWYERRFP